MGAGCGAIGEFRLEFNLAMAGLGKPEKGMDALDRQSKRRRSSRIHIPYRIYSIHSTFMLVQIVVNHAKTGVYGFGGRIALYGSTAKPGTLCLKRFRCRTKRLRAKSTG